MLNELLLLWSQRPAISLAVWLVLLVTVLYLAREPAHQLLKSTGRAIYRFMRSAARAVAHLEQRALQRNREIVLAQGREATEKFIEREFVRINEIVARDLSHYPALHREADRCHRTPGKRLSGRHRCPAPAAGMAQRGADHFRTAQARGSGGVLHSGEHSG